MFVKLRRPLAEVQLYATKPDKTSKLVNNCVLNNGIMSKHCKTPLGGGAGGGA